HADELGIRLRQTPAEDARQPPRLRLVRDRCSDHRRCRRAPRAQLDTSTIRPRWALQQPPRLLALLVLDATDSADCGRYGRPGIPTTQSRGVTGRRKASARESVQLEVNLERESVTHVPGCFFTCLPDRSRHCYCLTRNAERIIR